MGITHASKRIGASAHSRDLETEATATLAGIGHPNAQTAATLTRSEQGEDVRQAEDANDLYGQPGI